MPEEERICRDCGERDQRRPLDAGEVTEEVEYLPAQVVVIRWVREERTCACGRCVLTAPPPPRASEAGHYGPNVHAQVDVAKCCDAMPLHRQAKALALALEGCHVSPGQLGAMFHHVAGRVERIYKAIAALVPEAEHVSADETP